MCESEGVRGEGVAYLQAHLIKDKTDCVVEDSNPGR